MNIVNYQEISEAANIFTVDMISEVVENSISSKFDNQNILIKGVYYKNNKKEYNGYFYDRIKDINTNNFVVIKIPIKIQSSLLENKIYVFAGFLNFKLKRNDETNLNIVFTVTNLIREEKETIIDKSIEKYYEIFNKKKFKVNIKNIIEEKLSKNQNIEMALIYGDNAIVDKDVLHNIGEYQNYYNFYDYQANLNNVTSIINKLEDIKKDENIDIVALIRGGGSGLDIFNNFELLEYCATYTLPIITAIGHKEDVTYISSISDKDFATPSNLGIFLKYTMEEYFNNLQELRQKNMEFIRKEIKGEYEKQYNKLFEEKDNYFKKIINEKDVQLKSFNNQIIENNKQNKENIIKIENTYKELINKFENQIKENNLKIEKNEIEYKNNITKLNNDLLETNKNYEKINNLLKKYSIKNKVFIGSIILLIIIIIYLLF